jgi:hypothetical protein
MAGKYPKAINGFKQLSGKDDSLSQHAMYLLGDSYLKVGEKAMREMHFYFAHQTAAIKRKRKFQNFNTQSSLTNSDTRMKR